MKKDLNLPNKTTRRNNKSGKIFSSNSNWGRQQSSYNTNYRGRPPYQKIHKTSDKTDIVDHMVELFNIEVTIQNQFQTNLNFRLMPVFIQILEIKITQIIDLETLQTIYLEVIPTIGIETIQIIETLDIKIIDHAIILTTDQNIVIIKIDHAIIHRPEIQVTTIGKETTLSITT